MTLNRSWILAGIGAVFAASAVWAGFLFSPGHQLEKTFSRLIHAAESRDWNTVRSLMAEDYRDQWGMDREQALSLAAEGLRHFLVLEITPADTEISRDDRSARIVTRLVFTGRGNAIGDAILQRAESLQNDFQFAWQRKSWKPWDWKLVSINQSEIEIDPSWMP